jgi:hypothetical protein
MKEANWLRINDIRTEFAAAVLHELKNGRGLTDDAFKFVKEDPKSLLCLIPTATKLVLSKVWSD